MKLNLRVLCAFATVLAFQGVYGQKEKLINYNAVEVSPKTTYLMGVPQIDAASYKIYQIDLESLKSQLSGIANRATPNDGYVARIEFPHPDGTFHSYRATGNNTMSAALAAQFPEIKSYDANGEGGSFVKWDITPKGLHVMILQPGKSTVFIDPLFDGNTNYYIVYAKKDFETTKGMECAFDADVSELLKSKKAPVSGEVKAFGTCELRTYRLALSATGEYTAFHGGTVALALAAQVTTMNRVNGVFERDIAITMEIIANNNLIVYTNAASDPFTNGTPGTMITQNQNNTTTVIGSANYDIGHVFGTNSGGLAGLGVVCDNNNKARGVTGSAAPIGDPFDIDYVAHEMGHQFGANHTQNNNCNRNNATAMEPGSASTIMGYAGICAPNVQNNSDDHFHGVSLGEIHTEIMSGGHTCEQISALSNDPPIILSTNANISVPVGTPFALTAVANDPNSDPLSYCWEQMNATVSTQPPVASATAGPNFRSFSPDPSPTRYFPNLQALANNGPFTWEVIPTVARTMNFRLTVRDQGLGVPGCNDHEDVTISFSAGAGPFVVNYPSAAGIVWTGATSETVTWSVANTNTAPVNCSLVDIFLSTDGGLTYPTQLANDVPNDGSETITVPNVSTTTARVMVISSAGTFFDISNNNFTIQLATYDFTQSATPPSVSVCQPDNAVYTISIGQVGGYSDPVTLSVLGLPAGTNASFSTNPVTPVGSSTLTISNTIAAVPGSYTLTIQGVSTSGTKNTNVTLTISNGNPTAVSQIAPANGATGVNVPTDFTWTTSPGVGITYEIEIATDPAFTAIVDQASGLLTPDYTSAVLLSSTTYYWRVRAATGCGQSAWSSNYNFVTSDCSIFQSVDVGQSTNVASFTSELVVSAVGVISGINVVDLDISHPWVGDLGATLTSPSGTVVNLFDGPGIPASTWGCDGDDMLVNFDDAAAQTSANLENMCAAGAPTISGTFQSIDPLAGFIGEPMNGTWILTVYDSYTAGDVGTLNGWGLEICIPAVICTDPDLATVAPVSSVCEGSSAVLTVSSGNLNDATDWQWYEGSCGGTYVGAGTSISVSPSVTTTYYVRGEGGCVVPGSCQSITVVVNETFAISENIELCSGSDYTYPDGTVSLNVSANEAHVSNLSSAFGCDSVITTNLTIVTSFNMSENIAVCPNATVTYPDGVTETITSNTSHTSNLISAQGCDSAIVTNVTVFPVYNEVVNAAVCRGDDYVYPDGTTSTNILANESHTSNLVSMNGCDSIVVTNLTVNSVDNSVSVNGATLTANAAGASYQWVDCENGFAAISGETGVSFTATNLTGTYAVIVTQNGCSDTSACVLVDQSGIEELAQEGLTLSPNPSTGTIKLVWTADLEELKLYDAAGRLVYAASVADVHELYLDLPLSKGVYHLHLTGIEHHIIKDLIRQ